MSKTKKIFVFDPTKDYSPPIPPPTPKLEVNANTDWKEIIDDLAERAKKRFEEICTKNGKFEHEFRISSQVRDGYHVVIKAGLVPEIIVSENLFRYLVTRNRTDLIRSGQLYINNVLRMCYENARKVRVSLTSIVPISNYRVLKADVDKFLWGADEESKYLRPISQAHFQISVIHTVTVTDPITESSVSVSDEDLGVARNNAIRKMQRLIAENDDLYSQYDNWFRASIKPPQKPIEVDMRLEENGSITSDNVYSDRENEESKNG